MASHPALESVARNLVALLAPRRGITFNREIHVEECGGDVDVSLNRVIIHPFFLTEGDPVATMEHVLDVCAEFDKKYNERTQRAIIELKHRLRHSLSELLRLGETDAVQSIIEEELSIHESTILQLTEAE